MYQCKNTFGQRFCDQYDIEVASFANTENKGKAPGTSSHQYRSMKIMRQRKLQCCFRELECVLRPSYLFVHNQPFFQNINMSDKFDARLTDFVCTTNLQINLKSVGVRKNSQTSTPMTQISFHSGSTALDMRSVSSTFV